MQAISGWIRESVRYAWDHPDASRGYVLSHSQELAPEVVQAHIDLYVNDYSADLGVSGLNAVRVLLERAARESLVPAVDMDRLMGV
jgi:1,4-dihydroxy-6-naphthoate synthase